MFRTFLISALLFVAWNEVYSQDSLHKEYHTNGKLKCFHIKKGEGLFYEKYFDEWGKLCSEGLVRFSKNTDVNRCGEKYHYTTNYLPVDYTGYYRNTGKIAVRITDTSETFFDSEGIKTYQTQFKKENPGTGTAYQYSNGIVIYKIQYRDGKKHGPEIQFHGKNKFIERTFNYDKECGPTTFYDPDGKISRKLFFNDKGGTTKILFYDSEGKVARISTTKSD